MSDAVNRRTFLKIAGSVGAAAGCSRRTPPEKLIPYLIPPDNVIPGTPTFYRTACRECTAACGVTARSREGRVIKLEGNPEDPISGGALCARGQAALQGLYAPDRLHGPMRRDGAGRLAPISWDEALGVLATALGKANATSGGVRLITRAEPGSAGALQKKLLDALGAPEASRVVLEPLEATALREASRRLYGRPELPVYDLASARSVVSFGADFLETWGSPVELARGFASGRGRADASRTRFTWIAPRLGATGASADRWLAVRPGAELPLALALLRALLDPATGTPELPLDAAAIRARVAAIAPGDVERETGVAASHVAALARELAERRPSAVLGPGIVAASAQATELAIAIHLVNHVLGNIGRTVKLGLDPLDDPASPFTAVQALLADLAAARVSVLLVHHADPVGSLPAALGAAAALARVPLVVSFAGREDATTAHAHLVVPDHHWLESFGDVTPRRGVVELGQPTMRPLYDTRAASQVLLDVGAHLPDVAPPPGATDFRAFASARLTVPPDQDDADAFKHEAQRRGGVYTSAEAPPPPVPALDALASLTAKQGAELAGAGSLVLVPFPTALRGDGSSAHHGWLREVPDVVSGLSWVAWAELSPATAGRLGIGEGDRIAVTTAGARAELFAHVHAGLRDDVVAVPLGGPEALALVAAPTDPASGSLAWISTRADVARIALAAAVPIVDIDPGAAGMSEIRTVSLRAPALPHPAEGELAPELHPDHRWGMAIDLDRCTGCQACVVACYAENNVPVLGPKAAAEGRTMAWIRVDRATHSEGDRTRIDFLPMLCQQCTAAPCEPVCPVYATYHTPEGLNAQVYNRCVGTRYCSNNCPYKVRTFNWSDPLFEKPLDMQLNPDVSVRSKGVMEKCTFCVQRIRLASNNARQSGKRLVDGDVVTACAQTCPTQAIVFGDRHDPASRASTLSRGGRCYHVLNELATGSAITYLARVREDEP